MKFYVIHDKWPLYYKKDEEFIPLGNFEVKSRNANTHAVQQELTAEQALDYVNTNFRYSMNNEDGAIASEFINKHLFYKDILD